MSSFYQFETPLTVHADPINPMHAVSKQYVDNKATNIDGSRFVSGTIGVEKLPSLTGDVTSVVGTNELILNNSGVAPGVYTGFTVDGKGRVVAGTFTPVQTTDLSWLQVQNTPTTLGGYGITDVVSRDVGDTVTSVTMTAPQATGANAVVTKNTVDTLLSQINLDGVLTGEVVKRPTATTPAGFLKANGGMVNKTTYANLYMALGISATRAVTTTKNVMGRPWYTQHAFNETVTDPNILKVFVNSGLQEPTEEIRNEMRSSIPCVLKNRVYFFSLKFIYFATIDAAGAVSTTIQTYNATPPWYSVYGTGVNRVFLIKNRLYVKGVNGVLWTATVYPDGTITGFTQNQTLLSLPGVTDFYRVNFGFTNKKIYAICGANKKTFYAPLFDDGSIGNWSEGPALPAVSYDPRLVTIQNTLHLITGVYNGTNANSVVLKGVFGSDGVIANWTVTTDSTSYIDSGGGGSDSLDDIFVTKDCLFISRSSNIAGSNASYVYAPIVNGVLGQFTRIPIDTTYFTVNLYTSCFFATKSRIYLLQKGSTVGIAYTLIYVPMTPVGVNEDYVSLISSNTVEDTTVDTFKLPDFTPQETGGLYYYIKY